MPFRVWTETHSGAVRKHNEDAFVSRPDAGLWAVADGAGGHQSGEVASGMLATSLGGVQPGLSGPALLAAVRTRVSAVHDALRQEAQRRGDGGIIASTIVVLVIDGGQYTCLWAGDSRAYRLRDGALTQLTRDHSLVQELVDSGAIKPEQADTHPQANVITRAVGSDEPELELDRLNGILQDGDHFLLCSDGLCKALTSSEMAQIMMQHSEPGPAAGLIKAALARAARDNVTAVVVAPLPAGGAARA
jgi:protein phosphatase/serine/threonine-protein phosphatase Stp1